MGTFFEDRKVLDSISAFSKMRSEEDFAVYQIKNYFYFFSIYNKDSQNHAWNRKWDYSPKDSNLRGLVIPFDEVLNKISDEIKIELLYHIDLLG